MFGRKFPWVHVTSSFVMGVLAGGVAALLLAPMKGKKLQKKVAGIVEDQVGNVEKMMKRVVNA